MDRKVSSEVGVIPHCTGSSRFSCNGVTVFCTVQGPLFGGGSWQENHDSVFLEVKWRDSVPIGARAYDKYFSGIIKKILSKYIIVELDCYKTLHINISVVGEERIMLFCAVNAIFLALVDGGIPLKSMFFAVSTFCNEEEIAVFCDDEAPIYHSFGTFSGINFEDVKHFLEYIKEIQKYALRQKLQLSIC